MEPKISLPDKLDGMRKHFRGFINQIKLIDIQQQTEQYVDDFRQVGLIGTLLSRAAQTWFAPLVETSSPLLHNFLPLWQSEVLGYGPTPKCHYQIVFITSRYASGIRLRLRM